MKKNSKSNSIFNLPNILLVIIIFILFFYYSKIRKIDIILEKVIKIEKKLDEELVPSTRIKRNKNKKKKKDWRN
tara:strand:- start:369 stop:590 length:222 start_codon:yes stop_codon:yes gene_type:complete